MTKQDAISHDKSPSVNAGPGNPNGRKEQIVELRHCVKVMTGKTAVKCDLCS